VRQPQPRVGDGQWLGPEGEERCREDEERGDRCSGQSRLESPERAVG
jgi:hypothetical protein